ncbi:MAG: hypothetical protein M1812_000928 [Candelaria pacifica]|nr:MAG: hypothetical protein M1812_000928 [Candelaria pacifica]
MPCSEHSDGSHDELDCTPNHLFAQSQLDTGSSEVGDPRGYGAGARHYREISSNVSGERERKRKRNSQDTSEDYAADQLESFDILEATVNARSQKRLRIAAVDVPNLVFPKSLYHGWERPSEVYDEREVIKAFLDEQAHGGHLEPASEDELNSNESSAFQLTDFSIYVQGPGPGPVDKETRANYELMPLNALKTRNGVTTCFFYFDGTLTNGKIKRYVERVPFDLLSIGNYGPATSHSVGDKVWIASKSSFGAEVWYQLAIPSPEYERYYTPFIWLANFTKHFVDYLGVSEGVMLKDFREDFHHWLVGLHGQDTSFQKWHAEFGDSDFRRVVVANTEFLWKEAADPQVDRNKHNKKQPIWNEIGSESQHLTIVKEERCLEKKTVVTPFVFDVFRDMEWAGCMDSRTPSLNVCTTSRGQNPRSESTQGLSASVPSSSEDELCLNQELVPSVLPQPAFQPVQTLKVKSGHTNSVAPTGSLRESSQAQKLGRISVGDVVALPPDATSKWTSTANLWFAYVQNIEKTSSGLHHLDLLWLYSPCDTTCDNGRYPFSNELFLSDNCSCEDKPTYSSEVVSKIPVSFFGSPGESEADYFVRQKYRSVPGEEAFVTLQQSDFSCWHQTPNPKSEMALFMEKYAMGDTILVGGEVAGTAILEPVEIVSFGQASSQEAVQVRRLLRRKKHFEDKEARPNELIYTDELYHIPVERLTDGDHCRRCYVRFYTPADLQQRRIPAPYSRDGTADAYYIVYRQAGASGTRRLEPIVDSTRMSLKQGFDPLSAPTRPPLRGMDLYCGGGNFGRGLEEGGAVQNCWAVDWAKHAIHTYRANLRDPDATELYYGSVNDYLAKAMQGTTAKNIAKRGEVDFISAGSPCQGFSNANQNKKSQQSLQNSSMVSSVAAFIDFYRPKYALLENVTAMASRGKKSKEGTVFSQLICCLVALGYQVQHFNIDAWSFGSPQSRCRLFISIAAPGLELPRSPALTHSHPPTVRNARLGVAANGLSFGERRNVPTPFEYISASEATKDLPLIGGARVQMCVTHPDHRTSRVEYTRTRVQISQIPRNPKGQTFITAYNSGRIGKPQIEGYTWGKSRNRSKSGARSWGRITSDGLMPTITTSISPDCAFTGRCLHWDEHRLLTVMEARRAQGFPDHEVLVGAPAKQWKIVGNSVARTVALALGMSLRSAWLANAPGPPEKMAQSISIGASLNHAVEVSQGNSVVQTSSLSSKKISFGGRLEEEESPFFTITKPTTDINLPAPSQGSCKLSEQERLARKSKTYRRLTGAPAEVHHNHSATSPLAPKSTRNKELFGHSEPSVKKLSNQLARGPERSVANTLSSFIQSPSPPFSFLEFATRKTKSFQENPKFTSRPTIVISDDEEEVVYLGTSTPSSKVISSAQSTSENPRSSRTSASIEADLDELYFTRDTKHAAIKTNTPAQSTSFTQIKGRPALNQLGRRRRPPSNDELDKLQKGAHGLLRQKPFKRTTDTTRY